MAVEPITQEEEKAIAELQSKVAETDGCPTFARPEAQKFLLARKGDVTAAYELYLEHRRVYAPKNLLDLSGPPSPAVRDQLLSGKFVLPGTRDRSGAAILVVNADKHLAGVHSEPTLHALLWLLTQMTNDLQTQRNGITVLYDLSRIKWANVDRLIFFEALDILKGAFPGRVKHFLLYQPPVWLSLTVQIYMATVRLLVGGKQFEKVAIVSKLSEYVLPNALPQSLEGLLSGDPGALISRLLQTGGTGQLEKDSSYTVDLEVVSTEGFSTAPQSMDKPEGDAAETTQPEANAETAQDVTVETTEEAAQVTEEEPYSIAEQTATTMTMDDLQDRMNEYDQSWMTAEFMSMPVEGDDVTYEASRQTHNLPKNRYTNILAYDHNRVKISSNPDDDYINANYVDGFNRPSEYIASQGPLPETYGDFWHMIWREGSEVVVMATREVESGRLKCGRYWPEPKATVQHGAYTIIAVSEKDHNGFVERHMTLKTDGQEREIVQFQFVGWPDHGVPSTCEPLLFMLQKVHQHQESTGSVAPIVVHCSAGIGRTGTFITVDLNLQRIAEQDKLDVHATVSALRQQRYGMVQTPQQYSFIYMALYEGA